MAIENDGTVLRGIERIFNQGSLTGLSEAQLLRRFAAGDEAAFEALVTRHGPMVLSVCRRSLFDHRDVEDAFQATFLVLIRKAEALRDGDLLGPWLHGVAYRVASRIRSRVIRRPTEERKGAQPEAVESTGDLERNEIRGLLDEEIRRLPEKYRTPVVLCYLEGRTHEEAARRLRCSTGSVRGRLDRARHKLRDRLTRRGLAPAAGLTTLAALGEAASAAVPAPLLAATVATLARAATASAVATTESAAAAIELADGVFRAMIVAKLKLAAMLVFGILALVALPLVFALEPRGPRIAASRRPARPSPAASPRAPGDREQGITVTGRVLDEAGRPIAGAGWRKARTCAPVTRSARPRLTRPADSRCPESHPAADPDRPGATPRARIEVADRRPGPAAGRIPAGPRASDPGPDCRRPRQAHRERADLCGRVAPSPLAAMEFPDRRRRPIPLGRRAGRPRADRPGHARFQREAFLEGHARRARKYHLHAPCSSCPRPDQGRRHRPADHRVHRGAGLHLGGHFERPVAK